ncbi:MAG: hypothetical protein FWC79_01160 [Oscillospiraceae bacterium]|nr:hypothetical protein [Oscillospiraceae bacterium]
MNSNILEMTNSLGQSVGRENSLTIAREQDRFFDTTLGRVINRGIDLGIRAIFPEFLENKVIDVKDALINEGLNSAIRTAIDQTLELGRRALSDFLTRGFRNVSDARDVLETGDLLANVSKELDHVIERTERNNADRLNIGSNLSERKAMLLEMVRRDVDSCISEQIELTDTINSHITKWNDALQKGNFRSMENEFAQVQEKMVAVMPTENMIKDVRTLENLHNLIKNNGRDFNISEYERKVAEILA